MLSTRSIVSNLETQTTGFKATNDFKWVERLTPFRSVSIKSALNFKRVVYILRLSKLREAFSHSHQKKFAV